MINEAVIFCQEWNQSDMQVNNTKLTKNQYLEKLLDLARDYHKEGVLLPVLVKLNGFDFYTLSLLKSLPDDFLLNSKHITSIIEQINYQKNMINYERDVRNNLALKSICQMYQDQSCLP